jgi:hypothetical protein
MAGKSTYIKTEKSVNACNGKSRDEDMQNTVWVKDKEPEPYCGMAPVPDSVCFLMLF